MEIKDIEQINNQYTKDKAIEAKLEKINNLIETCNKSLIKLERNREDIKIQQTRAIEDGDELIAKQLGKDLEVAEKEVELQRKEIAKLQKVINKNQEKVNSHIHELLQNPEMRQYVTGILSKRYERKLRKEKEEKTNLDNLVKIIKEHPNLEFQLQGMIRANEEIQKLQDELGKLDVKADADRINEIKENELPELLDKYDENKENIQKFLEKSDANVSIEYIESLVKNENINFAYDKGTGKILVGKTLKNMQKGYNKRIQIYERANERLKGTNLSQEPQKEQSQNDEAAIDYTDLDSNNLPAEEPKKWQFIKRFRNWLNRRKEEKEQPEETTSETQSNTNKNSDIDKFKSAYKFDVVKDVVDQLEQENYNWATKEIKQQKATEQNVKEEER